MRRLFPVLAALAALAALVLAVRSGEAARTAGALLALAWAGTAVGCGRTSAKTWAPALVAVAHAAAAAWPVLAPIAIASWPAYALALPGGILGTRARRAGAGLALAAGAALIPLRPGPGMYGAAVALAAVSALGAIALRCPRATPRQRQIIQWAGAGVLLAGAADAVLLTLHLLLDAPAQLLPSVIVALAVVPLAILLGHLPGTSRLADRALLEAVVMTGLAVMVVAVYLVVVVGLGHMPVAADRDILLSSIVAALAVAVLALPLRARLLATGSALIGRTETPPEEVLATFGARMSRAVPFDELLLQLAESLRDTTGPAGAEVWVGSDGVLTRTVSVPEQPAARLELTERERIVVGRTRAAGASWMAVWLPSLLAEYAADAADAPIRVAPVAHLGELLGLIVVRRPADALPYGDEDDRLLVELARQVGLALHNMRLDTALQASLDELRRRNEELQASRLRIVTAGDTARRAIEHDLHDGAQQHLVALSVKLGLAADEDPDELPALLEELRGDVQETITAVRELAHGIYPPLLRNQGLGTALSSAARRSANPCTVSVDLADRYREEIEAAVYFCCLEAIQNAGKHAPDAAIEVCVSAADGMLTFEIRDDGPGFEAGESQGAGFVNMADRLGAVGGRLRVISAPGKGTTVRGEVPSEI